MHVKKWNVEEFLIQKKGNLLFKKIKECEGKEEWVQEEGDQENKRSNKKGDEKRMKETYLWKKNTNNDFSKEIQCVKRKSFFFQKKKVKKDTKLTLKKQEREMKGRSFQEENFLFLSDSKDQGKNIFRREK